MLIGIFIHISVGLKTYMHTYTQTYTGRVIVVITAGSSDRKSVPLIIRMCVHRIVDKSVYSERSVM